MGRADQTERKNARELVFERDGYTCRYCGRKDGPLHADHVYPYTKGGETSIDNMVTACEKCNTSKGSKVGIWPKPIGYFDAQPSKPNLNIVLWWGITNLIISFFGMSRGGGSFTMVVFWVGVFQCAIGLYMVFSNIRFDEAFQVESQDETE
jgi:hypothetical protein